MNWRWVGVLFFIMASLVALHCVDGPSAVSPPGANPEEAGTPSPPTPTPTLTPIPTPTLTPTPLPSTLPTHRLVLALYFQWYDDATWSDEITFDRPLEPYHSDNPEVMRRQLTMAASVGIDGFVAHWLLPGNRTDTNFARLLQLAEGTTFRATVHILTNALFQASWDDLRESIRYVVERYTNHPNFLHHQGKPVLFFSNMAWVGSRSAGGALAAWRELRNQIDPERRQLWIAEGFDPSYLSIFDGLYVMKISHLISPNDYLKLPRWGQQVRNWERRYGEPKLWIATVMPGWDDTRTRDRPGDLRDLSPPHRRDREEGRYYQKTMAGALESRPDWVLIHSFNEWVEGSAIEPSQTYGNLYLELTAQFVRDFKGG